MESITEKFTAEIIVKIKKMKSRISRLESENQDLKSSVFAYLQQLEAQKKEYLSITQSSKNAQMAVELGQNKKTHQKELDKYILLIDKCIASVNSKL